MTRQRTVTFLIALAALTVLIVAIALRPGPPTDIVRIGGVLPLTGDAGTFGQNASRGAQLAVEHANSSDKAKVIRFEFIAEDSRGDASQAVAAGRKLIDRNAVQLMIGDVTSAATHALIPIAARSNIPLVSPAASDPALSGISPTFARTWPSDDFEAKIIGDYALKQRYRRIAFIYANTDYGLAMIDEMAKVIGRDMVSLDIPLERETPSFRPTIQRVQQSDCDSLFLVLYPEDAKRFLQQLAETSLKLPILATATFEDPTLLNEPLSDRVVFASPTAPDDNSRDRSAFVREYQRRFGEKPGVLSDVGYDTAMLLIAAYVATNHDRSADSVIDYIRSLRDYSGVSGLLTFTKDGDVVKPYGLRTVKDGAFVWLSQKTIEQ